MRPLRDINTMRAIGLRHADPEALRRHEAKLFELDLVNGYDRTWWAVHGQDSDMRPLRHGEKK